MRDAQKPSCPVCGKVATEPFLTRRQVAVHQNLLVKDPESALRLAEGHLELRLCMGCGFIFNHKFAPSLLRYGGQYDNTQDLSPAFDHHLDRLVRHLTQHHGIRRHRIVEVGCGKGTFLQRLLKDNENLGVGFDPSYLGPDVAMEGRLKFERRYYGPECTEVEADVVICRHVIEHVPDPVGLLRLIRTALEKFPTARVFFETPCAEWILRNQAYWDFFYEHCSYFTSASLTVAFERAGFVVQDVRHVFEGQYLWLEASPAIERHRDSSAGQDLHPLTEQYSRAELDWIANWKGRLEARSEPGAFAIWGAGAKGATFASLVDPERKFVGCVVDINPNKQGCFVPGTAHPIIGPHELLNRGVKTVVLMNPNYHAEVLALLEQIGYQGDVVGPM